MDLIEKYWLKFPIALYAIGLIVNNVYLAQFGSYDFELFKSKYILSGLGFVGFIVIFAAYTCIKINISYIGESLRLPKLLPWITRLVSFPYVVYAVLYGSVGSALASADERLALAARAASSIAFAVVLFSILDLVLMASDGASTRARLIRAVFSLLAVPMVVVTLLVSHHVPAFSGVANTALYFFMVLVGAGLQQTDKKHGVEPNYLDSSADKRHEYIAQMVIGVIAIFFMLGTVVTDYTKYIFPRIPAALGGEKLEPVEIYYGGKVIDASLIQESDQWILFINNSTKHPEQLRATSVQRVVYMPADHQLHADRITGQH